MQNQLHALGVRLRHGFTPVAATTALVVAVTLFTVPNAGAQVGSSAPTGRVVGAALAEAASAPAQARDRDRKIYTPKLGVITNDPRSADRRRLLEHIIKSIGSTRRKQKIRIISWNVASSGFVDKLIAAHKRGVSVRLLMAEGKTEGNNDYFRLKNALQQKRPNIDLPKKFRSWARACEGSCRGARGIAHSKLFIFSKVGNAERVVMSTSANATEVSVNYQWNDLFTMRDNKVIYRGFMQTFQESVRDKPVDRAYRVFKGQAVSGYVYPWKGKDARGDRVIKELKRVTCNGAKGGTGINGKTRIRIAQDAIIDDRGIAIAKILRHKWQSGCNIKIVYALMGKQVLSVLRNTSRGPVPIRQIVNDFDEDGIYDRYLHSKSMAVSGYYRNDRSARVAWQGSENWSGLAKLSDEQGFKIERGGAEGVYARWVDSLFANPPQTTPKATARLAAERGVDPYALIREELGLPARTR